MLSCLQLLRAKLLFNSGLNRKVVKLRASHHIEYWKERNEYFHNPQKQREYVIEWIKALEERILRSCKINATWWLRNNNAQIESKMIKHLQQRNRLLIEILTRVRKERIIET